MSRGPLGFEDQTDYCLIQHRPDTSFRWLQSIDEPSLAFVVADPSEFFADYDIEVPDSETGILRLKNPDDALVLTIVTISDGGSRITANLAAPIVINSRELIGLQVILQDNRHSVEQPLVVNRDRSTADEARQDPKPAARAA
jgi:flagellar assembly factor FliW